MITQIIFLDISGLTGLIWLFGLQFTKKAVGLSFLTVVYDIKENHDQAIKSEWLSIRVFGGSPRHFLRCFIPLDFLHQLKWFWKNEGHSSLLLQQRLLWNQATPGIGSLVLVAKLPLGHSAFSACISPPFFSSWMTLKRYSL